MMHVQKAWIGIGQTGHLVYRYNHHGAHRRFAGHLGLAEAIVLVRVPADRDCSRHAKTQALDSGAETEQPAPRKMSQRRKWMERLKQTTVVAEEPHAADEAAPDSPALSCPILAMNEEFRKRGAAMDESASLQGPPPAANQTTGRQRTPRSPRSAPGKRAAEQPRIELQGGMPSARAQAGPSQFSKHEHESAGPIAVQADIDATLHSTDSICPVVEEDAVNEYIFTACSSGVVHQWAQDKQTQCDRFEVCSVLTCRAVCPKTQVPRGTDVTALHGP